LGIKNLNLTKITFTPVTVLILVGLSIVLTTGIVYAAHTTTTHTGTVVIEAAEPGTGNLQMKDGNLNVLSGRLFFSRAGSGLQSQIFLDNDNRQSTLNFQDSDSGRIYIQRYTADGKRFDFLDATGGIGRVDLSIKTTTGNIGMGTTNPTSKLHVVGDLTLQSDILCTECIDTTDIKDGTILFSDINQNGCATNEIMKWDGASWICAVDSGTSGAVGATGMTGTSGATGMTGTPGTTGMTGTPGTTGSTGMTGATGMTGVGGDPGATGMTGMTGMTGKGGTTLVTQYFSTEIGISAFETQLFTFDCPFATEWVVSGGIIETDSITPGFILKDSVPLGVGTWLITAENSSASAVSYLIWVICLDFISTSGFSASNIAASEDRESIVLEPIPFTQPKNIRGN